MIFQLLFRLSREGVLCYKCLLIQRIVVSGETRLLLFWIPVTRFLRTWEREGNIDRMIKLTTNLVYPPPFPTFSTSPPLTRYAVIYNNVGKRRKRKRRLEIRAPVCNVETSRSLAFGWLFTVILPYIEIKGSPLKTLSVFTYLQPIMYLDQPTELE